MGMRIADGVGVGFDACCCVDVLGFFYDLPVHQTMRTGTPFVLWRYVQIYYPII